MKSFIQPLTQPKQSLTDIITKIAPEDASNSDTIRSIVKWFEKTRPEKTARDYLAQLACHFEEVAECTEALGLAAPAIRKLSTNIRTTDAVYADTDYQCRTLPEGWRKELLDSLCDQIVTAIGVAHCANLDIVGALAEVNYSNWSKFENGEPIRDEHGKIIKGRNYKTPVLDGFVLEAPKWVSPEPKAGMRFKCRDNTEVVEVLCVSTQYDNDNRQVVTYRFVNTGDCFTAPESVFRRRFEGLQDNLEPMDSRHTFIQRLRTE